MPERKGWSHFRDRLEWHVHLYRQNGWQYRPLDPAGEDLPPVVK